jgi:small-conductance mechanosensitive channel
LLPDSLSRGAPPGRKRDDDLAAKLELSEKAREKAEKDDVDVGDLRQRLHDAENALNDKISHQIARENSIIDRLNTQNRRFVSKFFPSHIFVSILICFSKY